MNIQPTKYKHYLKTSQYTIRWDKKVNPNSDVVKYFYETSSAKPDKPKVNYWIPFKYGNNYYLMTFNNCYEVEVLK